jgi:serine/threonine protein kinase
MEEGKYNGLQSDMFAVGVVLFIMYNGSPPFMSAKPHDRIYRLIREKNFAKFWEKHEKGRSEGFFSPSFKRLMNSFFSTDPARRPTFESLEDDEWWNGKDLTQEELEEYMRPKFTVLFENSPINDIKKSLFKQKIEEAEEKKEELMYD